MITNSYDIYFSLSFSLLPSYMADLTVLLPSPPPLPGLSQTSPLFTSIHRNQVIRPPSPSPAPIQPFPLHPPTTTNSLLSPPVDTWRSRPRHTPTRSASAPPAITRF